MAGAEDNVNHPPSWINADLIQDALRSGEKNQHIRVLSMEVKSPTAAGDNYLSDLFRVTCKIQTGKETSESRSLIVKCHPVAELREELTKNTDMFKRESLVMLNTVPAMIQLLEEAAPGKYQQFAPKCLSFGDKPIKYVIMEDLKPLGFTMRECRLGLDLPHSLLVIKTLATFHAASTALLAKDPTALDVCGEGAYNNYIKELFHLFVRSAVRCLAEEVSTWEEFKELNYSERILKLQDTLFDDMVKATKYNDSEWTALTHFDPWINNMLFQYKDGNVQAMRLLDYQTCSRASPAIDVLYFLCTSLSMEVRLHHIQELLDAYIVALNAALVDLGCAEVSMEKLRQAMKEHARFAFYGCIVNFPITLSDPKDAFDLELCLKQTEGSAVNHRKIYSSQPYVSMMKLLLPIFDKKGLF